MENKTVCDICGGEGWVCENHSQQAWNNGEGHWVGKMSGSYRCNGAGAPCKCNTQYKKQETEEVE